MSYVLTSCALTAIFIAVIMVRATYLERFLMSNFQEVRDALQGAADAVELVNAKADQLIVAINDLRQGGGATAEQLDELLLLAGSIKQSAEAQGAEDDAALNPGG